MNDLRISLTLQAFDKASGPLRQVTGGVNGLAAAAGRTSAATRTLSGFGAGIAGLGSQLARAGAIAGTTGATMGVLFTRSMLGTAAQFEKFGAILETTERSAEKARAALNWANQFANETPYDIEEVTRAFVKLRTFGLDPTNGLLKTLGDTSAAMGLPLMQSIEAIADAVTGENERLLEFGIKAHKQGGKITYEYTKRSGEQARAVVDANNRKMIKSTLRAIWNDAYGVAMLKLSRTWDGMLSNMRGHWTTFLARVGDSGPFTILKGRLEGVLGSLDKMEKSGQLEHLAHVTGGAMAEGLNRAGKAADGLIASAGGLEGIAAGLGEKMGALAGAISSVADAMGRLVKLENDFERFLGFDPEKFGLVSLLSGKMGLGKAVRSDLEAAAKPIEQGTTWIRRKIGLEPEPSAAGDGATPSAASAASGRSVATVSAAQRAQQVHQFESRVRLEFSGLPQGMRVQPTAASPGLDLITEIQRRGPSMAGP